MDSLPPALLQRVCCIFGVDSEDLPGGGSPCAEMDRFTERLDNAIMHAIDDGYRAFMVLCGTGSGNLAAALVARQEELLRALMGLGGDCLRALQIHSAAVVPHKAFVETLPNPERDRCRAALSVCDEAIYQQEFDTPDCMENTYRFLAQNCGMAIAVWDGGDKAVEDAILDFQMMKRGTYVIPTDFDKEADWWPARPCVYDGWDDLERPTVEIEWEDYLRVQ